MFFQEYKADAVGNWNEVHHLSEIKQEELQRRFTRQNSVSLDITFLPSK